MFAVSTLPDGVLADDPDVVAFQRGAVNSYGALHQVAEIDKLLGAGDLRAALLHRHDRIDVLDSLPKRLQLAQCEVLGAQMVAECLRHTRYIFAAWTHCLKMLIGTFHATRGVQRWWARVRR